MNVKELRNFIETEQKAHHLPDHFTLLIEHEDDPSSTYSVDEVVINDRGFLTFTSRKEES